MRNTIGRRRLPFRLSIRSVSNVRALIASGLSTSSAPVVSFTPRRCSKYIADSGAIPTS